MRTRRVECHAQDRSTIYNINLMGQAVHFIQPVRSRGGSMRATGSQFTLPRTTRSVGGMHTCCVVMLAVAGTRKGDRSWEPEFGSLGATAAGMLPALAVLLSRPENKCSAVQ